MTFSAAVAEVLGVDCSNMQVIRRDGCCDSRYSIASAPQGTSPDRPIDTSTVRSR